MTNSKIRRIHHQGKVGFAVVIVMALAIAVFAGQVMMTELKDAEMDEDVDFFPPFEWVTPEEKRAEAISTGIQYMGVIALLFLGSILFKSIYHDRTPFTKMNVRLLALISLVETVLGVAELALILSSPLEEYTGFLLLISVAIVAYSISLIFKYGLTLQIESDETL